MGRLIMTLTKYNAPKEVEKKILCAIELKKELDKYEADIKAELLSAMKQNNILSIKNDKYSVTLATRRSYKAIGDVPAEFTKNVLDTTKVATYAKLYGETPDGIASSDTDYISWRAK